MVNVHRCRFVDYTPHSITQLSFSHPSTTKFAPSDLRLAVGRNNGDIEIWNPKTRWIHEFTLYGGKGKSIEGLVWSTASNDLRLFSIGGSTFITEWDLKTGLPLKNFDSNSSIIWSISINEDQDKIAVGCDDGTVVIVDISGGVGSIEHYAFLQRQDSRVLSLVWNGEFVIGGCADGRIRVWNVTNKQLVSTMKVDKSKTESTLVWSVLYLPKLNQIVSGDSTGSVKFWDFNHFTLLQTFKIHEADVLTLSTDLNNENLFTAGVDRKIYKFQTNENSKTNNKWSISSNRLFHSNDIRSISSYESKNFNFLVSGGVESCIVINSIKNFIDGQYKKLSFIPQEQHLTIHNNLIALWQDQTVKIWRFSKKRIDGVDSDDEDEEKEDEIDNNQEEETHFKDSYKLVAKLTLSDEDNITNVSFNSDGTILAVGRLTTTKIFQLTDKGSKLKISKIDKSIQGSKNSIFYGNNLIITTPENEIYQYGLDQDENDIVEYELPEITKNKPYQFIKSIKINRSKLIILQNSGEVDIIDLETGKSHSFLKLSSYITHIEITKRQTLVVLTYENKLYEFEIDSTSHSLTQWSKINSEFLPQNFLSLDTAIGLFIDGSNDYKVWIYGSNWLSFFKLNINVPNLTKKERKRNRQGIQIGIENINDSESDEDMEDVIDTTRYSERLNYLKNENKNNTNSNDVAFWITHRYRPILYANALKYQSSNTSSNEDQLVIVERPQFALSQPPPFKLNQVRF